MDRAESLRTGLPLTSFAAGSPQRRPGNRSAGPALARHGLLEYRLGHLRDDQDQVVIEPQVPDYWPRTPKLGAAENYRSVAVRYLRRRGNEMVLESPRAGALCFEFAIRRLRPLSPCCPSRRKSAGCGGRTAFRATSFLALLVDCQILFQA